MPVPYRCLPARLALACALTLPGLVGADGRGAQKPPAEPVMADAPTLLSQRGKALLIETFSTADWAKTLSPYKAETMLGEGHLRLAPQPMAGHNPQLSLKTPMTDVVVQVRFRLDGAKWTNVQVSDPQRKENLAAVGVDPRQVGMSSISGWGATTRFTELARAPLGGDPAAWHVLVVEWCGRECLAQLDGKVVVHGEAESFAMAKGQLSFNTSGDGVWYDEVRVWAGIADPAWAKRKEAVLKGLR